MREIKFRAFDKDVGEWSYSDQEYDDHFFEFENGVLKCFGIRDNAGTIHEPPSAESNECEPVDEFTGLKDKKGKEIYEGDILKEYWEPCEDDSAVVSGEYIGEVFYEDAGYWTRSKNHHHAITESCDSYEVIGNIYQNPELINLKL